MPGIEKREDGTHFETQILGRDKRHNVIFSKQKEIEVERKGMDCKPSTLKGLQGLCEEKGREVQKTVFRNQILEREGKRDRGLVSTR